MDEEKGWQAYYAKTSLKPRPTLTRALEYFEKNAPKEKIAIDIGCGNGRDTIKLLKEGWQVYAIDSSETAIKLLKEHTTLFDKKNLTAECLTFKQMKWQMVSLVNASLALPFCNKKNFENVWNNLVNSILVKGAFTGHFFGVNDDWKTLNLINKQELEHLFRNFKIEFLDEKEYDAPSATGPVKHWHIFEVLAIKK